MEIEHFVFGLFVFIVYWLGFLIGYQSAEDQEKKERRKKRITLECDYADKIQAGQISGAMISMTELNANNITTSDTREKNK